MILGGRPFFDELRISQGGGGMWRYKRAVKVATFHKWRSSGTRAVVSYIPVRTYHDQHLVYHPHPYVCVIASLTAVVGTKDGTNSSVKDTWPPCLLISFFLHPIEYPRTTPSLCVRTQIRGHRAGPLLPPPHYGTCLHC